MSCFNFTDVTKGAINVFSSDRNRRPRYSFDLPRFNQLVNVSFRLEFIPSARIDWFELLIMLQPSIKFATPQDCDLLKSVLYFIYFSEVRNGDCGINGI